MSEKNKTYENIYDIVKTIYDSNDNDPQRINSVSEKLEELFNERYTKREVDFSYLVGVFNVSGIDGLHKETQRLKELGKDPSDLILTARNK